MDRVKKWFANILHYEDLSLGGARTLSDIEKEYDRLKLQSQQQSVRISELETLLTDWLEYSDRVGEGYSEATKWDVDFYDRVEEVLNKNKTDIK